MPKASKPIKPPRGQILWETHLKDGAAVAVVTSDAARQKYFLYNIGPDGGLEKTATEKTPVFTKGKKKRGE